MSLAILFHVLCAQDVSDINISIIRSLRLCCWITTSVALFSLRCVLEIWCGWVLSGARVAGWSLIIQQHSRKLLMVDILMSETCWAHKTWNKIASDIKLVFHSSTVKYLVHRTCHWSLSWTRRTSFMICNLLFCFCKFTLTLTSHKHLVFQLVSCLQAFHRQLRTSLTPLMPHPSHPDWVENITIVWCRL